MVTRVKRTYNLSTTSVEQVRGLTGRPGLPDSQDAVVEEAIARLYREEQARAEADDWARAGADADFQHEVAEIRAAYGDRNGWPA